MLIVTGHVHIDPSDVDEFTNDIQRLSYAASAREGCLFYCVAPEDALAGRMLVVERWLNQGALTAHLLAGETVAFVEKWAGRMRGDVLKYDASNERPLMDE